MRSIIFLLSSIVVINVNAQQDPDQTMFWNYYPHMNPSMTGFDHDYFAAIGYRNQWVGLERAPKTVFANFGMRYNVHHGFGFNYSYDQIGFDKVHIAHINYDYQIHINRWQRLSIGAGVGAMNLSREPDWIAPTPFPDPLLDTIHETKPDVKIGISYINRNFKAGIGITHLAEERFIGTNGTVHNMARHYYLHADYLINVADSLKFKPQLLVRSDLVFTSIDFSVLFTLKDRYSLGAGYRVSDAITFIANWDIKKKYRVGYAFDLVISKLNGVTSSSHEFVLGFLINGKTKHVFTEAWPDF